MQRIFHKFIIGIIGVSALYSCNRNTIHADYNEFIINNTISIENLQFVTDSTLYAVGGIKNSTGFIYVSTNAGNSWQLLKTVPQRLNDLYLFNAQNGFFVGDTRDDDTINIVKLANGVIHDVSYKDLWSNSDLRSIQFIDSLRGFMASEAHQGLGYVFRTIDGGKSWKYERDNYNGYVDIAIYDESTIVGGTFGSIKKIAANGIDITPFSIDGDIFYDVDFITQDILVACGYNGKLYKSSNRGETWEIMYKNKIGKNFHFTNIEFVNQNVGFACGEKGALLKTVNAGSSWEIVDMDQSADFNALTYRNNSLYIATSNGSILQLEL